MVAIVAGSQVAAQQTTDENAVTTPSGNAVVTPPPPQNEAPFIIRNIIITGNRKTKQAIILRELPFKPGDHFQLQELVLKFETARRQLMNISLFHEVVVALKSFDGYYVDVSVEVKERWYIFPVPYFKIVDRNLNQWLVQHNASFSRVNYGLKLMYNNFSGRNDKLNAWIMNGYTRQVSMSYDRMYFDKGMKWGGKVAFSLGNNREVNYKTFEDKEVFLKDTSHFIRNFFKTNLEISYRRATKTRHRFGIGYNDEQVEDTIVKLNPAYFPEKRDRIRYLEVYYNVDYNNVDYIPYPLKGFKASLSLGKKGFNHVINSWELSLSTGAYWQLYPKTYFSFTTDGVLRVPFKQPFFNSRLLGYGNVFMQGYEYYVVDGVAGGCVKTALSRELFTFHLPVPKTRKQSVTKVPFRVFAKIYGNGGYVYNPQSEGNRFTNTMLYSGGFGIDILTLYDVNIKLEYSFNQIGQNALYLHRNSNF
jgi:outer membrane protein assembly factor BamA